jgi:hypothetical protein
VFIVAGNELERLYGHAAKRQARALSSSLLFARPRVAELNLTTKQNVEQHRSQYCGQAIARNQRGQIGYRFSLSLEGRDTFLVSGAPRVMSLTTGNTASRIFSFSFHSAGKVTRFESGQPI